MKPWYVLIAVLLCSQVSARERPTRVFKLHPVCQYGLPLGDFSYKTSDKFVYGQSRCTFGGGIALTRTVLMDQLSIGPIFFGGDVYLVDEKIEAQIMDRYRNDNFYITTGAEDQYSVQFAGIRTDYNLVMGKLEIEPTLRIGMAFFKQSSPLYVSRKMKNDNYAEEISIFPGEIKPSFFATGGLSVNKKIFKFLYLNVSCMYMYTAFNVTMKERTKDFLGNNREGQSFRLHQPVGSFQLEFGPQFRFWKGMTSKRPDKN